MSARSATGNLLRTPPRPRYSTTRSLLPHFGSPPASSMRTDIPGSSSDIDPQSSVGMSARRVGAINGNATNGDDGASPSSRRRGLRKRSGVEKEGKEIWLDDGGDDGDGDVKPSNLPTNRSNIHSPSDATDQTLKTPDPSLQIDPSIAPAGSMSVPPNFMFAGLRGGKGLHMPHAGVVIEGGEEDEDRQTRRRVLDFGKDAEGNEWSSNGLGLGAAFDETKEEGGTVDFVQWLQSHYKHDPPPYTISTPHTTRSALYTDLAESLPAFVSPPSKDQVSKLVVEAFPEARWEISPSDGKTQFVRGLVAREDHEPAQSATAMSSSLGPPPPSHTSRHRYTQSCGLADLAEIAERARTDHDLRTYAHMSTRSGAVAAAEMHSPPSHSSANKNPALLATPRRSALDELAAAAALSERSPMGKGRRMDLEDMDPDLVVDSGHAMKKRRTSSARSTVVMSPPNSGGGGGAGGVGGGGGGSWDASGWRQQPQSFDRSSMVIHEEDHVDSGAEGEHDGSDSGEEDVEMQHSSRRSRRTDDSHGGIRIVDPSQPAPIPLARGKQDPRNHNASTSSSYTSPVSAVSNIVSNGPNGHARNGSTNNAIYSRGMYAPSTEYVPADVPPLAPPTGPSAAQTKKVKGRGGRKSAAAAGSGGAGAANTAASSSASASSAVANGDDVWASPGEPSSSKRQLTPIDDGIRHQKPNFTYHELITHEIKRSPDGRLQLSEIYKRISERYPYFKLGDPGWQNSIRHNLSLKKCFVRVDRPAEGILDKSGKGGWWTYAPDAVEGGRPGRKGAHGRGTGEYRKGQTPSDIAEKEAGRTGEDDYQAWARALVANEVEAAQEKIRIDRERERAREREREREREVAVAVGMVVGQQGQRSHQLQQQEQGMMDGPTLADAYGRQ